MGRPPRAVPARSRPRASRPPASGRKGRAATYASSAPAPAGAFAARALARAGLDTVIVEEGERWTAERIRATHPLDRFAGGLPRRRHDDGIRQAADPAAAGQGDRWHDRDQLRHLLPPPCPGHQGRGTRDHGLALANPELLGRPRRRTSKRRSASPRRRWRCWDATENWPWRAPEALGWEAAPLRRNAPGCRGACQCAIGCPNTPRAESISTRCRRHARPGARIVSGLEREAGARRRRPRRRSARPSEPMAWRVRISAPLVIVAAGTIGTPQLLRRSGLARHRASAAGSRSIRRRG